MEIKELQKMASEAIKKRQEKMGVKLDPKLTLVHLTEEIGEIAKEIINEEMRKEKFNIDNLAEEIADSINDLLMLSTQYNVDLENVIIKKIKEIEKK
ncbi:hypothetical protein HYT23_05535 [Candidatus Pacearchaeota archaeon]|nr:hypothetical protein [Candidatus Pacearchaeota archaeon]